MCFTSFYSCSNDLVSLCVLRLIRQRPRRDKPEGIARKETVIFVQNKNPGLIFIE